MTFLRRPQEYLDHHHVHYQVLGHEAADTAPEITHTLHVSGKTLAKVELARSAVAGSTAAVEQEPSHGPHSESNAPAQVPFLHPLRLHHFQSRIEFMPTGHATNAIRLDRKFV